MITIQNVKIQIIPFYFILGFALGILAIYVTFTPPQIIWHHPSPSKRGKIVYEDKDKQCYRYLAEEVKCPMDTGEQVVDHPMIIGI